MRRLAPGRVTDKAAHSSYNYPILISEEFHKLGLCYCPIRYLKAVADHGSFTRAARALHVSLSQQIRDVQDPSSGALRLRFTPSFAIYLLAPLIRQYRDRFPGIALTVTEVAQEEVDSFGLSPQWLSHSPAPP